jgi:hypothetical protein
MSKTYEMIGACPVQIDPPYGEWIPVGYGKFKRDLDPGREALLVRYGCIRIVDEPKANPPVAPAKTT